MSEKRSERVREWSKGVGERRKSKKVRKELKKCKLKNLSLK